MESLGSSGGFKPQPQPNYVIKGQDPLPQGPPGTVTPTTDPQSGAPKVPTEPDKKPPTNPGNGDIKPIVVHPPIGLPTQLISQGTVIEGGVMLPGAPPPIRVNMTKFAGAPKDKQAAENAIKQELLKGQRGKKEGNTWLLPFNYKSTVTGKEIHGLFAYKLLLAPGARKPPHEPPKSHPKGTGEPPPPKVPQQLPPVVSKDPIPVDTPQPFTPVVLGGPIPENPPVASPPIEIVSTDPIPAGSGQTAANPPDTGDVLPGVAIDPNIKPTIATTA